MKITRYQDIQDNATVDTVDLTWSELVTLLTTHDRRDYKAGPCFSPATFINAPCMCGKPKCTDLGHVPGTPHQGHRIDENAEELHALVLDVDKGPDGKPLTEAQAMAAIERLVALGLQFAVASSHSHAPPEECTLRITVEINHSVPAVDWRRFYRGAVAYLDIPVEMKCLNESRAWYLPSAKPDAPVVAQSFEGAPLNVDAILAAAPAMPERAAPTTSTTAPPKVYPAASPELLARARKRLVDHGPCVLGSANEHARIAWGIVWNDYALAREEALMLWREWNATNFAADGTPWPWSDADAFASSGPCRDNQNWTGAYGFEREVSPAARAFTDAVKAGAAPPRDEVHAHYKAQRAKLARQTVDVAARVDAEYLGLLLSQNTFTGAKSEKVVALEHEGTSAEDALRCAALALVRRAPVGATDLQIAGLLARFVKPEIAIAAIAEAREACAGATTSAHGPGALMSPDGFVLNPETQQPIASQGNIDLALAKLGVVIRHDNFADRTMISHDGGNPEIATDAVVVHLLLTIDRDFHFRPAKDFFYDVISNRGHRNGYHPVLDFLDALTWDGVPRLDTWLSAYGGADDTEYTRAVGRLVLVAAVRRMRQPGCKFDEMLVLESPQGTLKSSALSVLAVRPEWFTDDLPLHADTQRQMESTMGKWIVEAGEMRGMRKAEIGALKAFLSRQHESARMAYGRLPRQAPRQFIVIGSTNDATYLKDTTGNRRFWPVRVKAFDIDAIRRDRDQIWAEAAHREALGESIRLDQSLYSVAEAEQEERRTEHPFEMVLGEVLGEHTGKIRIADCWQILGIDLAHVTQDHQNQLGEVMRGLGWDRAQRRYGDGKKTPTWSYLRGTPAEREHVVLKVEHAPLRVVRA